jgi:hypothetical protein
MEDWMNLEKLTLLFTNGIVVKSGENIIVPQPVKWSISWMRCIGYCIKLCDKVCQ